MKKSSTVRRRRTAVVPGLTLSLLFAACSDGGGGGDAPVQTDGADELSVALVEQLDTMPDEPFDTSTVILPNELTAEVFLQLYGEAADNPIGPQDAKNLLIARLTQRAQQLTTRSNWTQPAGPNGPTQPNGLAYVYGGKRVGQATASTGGCCPAVFGLDCSGLIYQLFLAAGVTLPEGTAATQRQTATLDAGLAGNETYARLYSEDLGVIALDKYKTGDLIYWNNQNGATRHIGIVLKKGDGTLAIFQSNGTSGRDAAGNCSPTQCQDNSGPKRGPRTIELTQASTFFAGANYQIGGVVRIQAQISGKWNFRLRCQSASFDVLDVELDFPVTENSQFTLTENFLDYNGDPLTGEFAFTYDSIDNVLSCEFSIASVNCVEGNPFRIEEFAVQLDRDDTDYFGTTELFRNGCAGCLAEVRLINQETTVLPDPPVPAMLEWFEAVVGERLGPASIR